jgi:hypothetical protein
MIDKANTLFPEALIWRGGGHPRKRNRPDQNFTINVTNRK